MANIPMLRQSINNDGVDINHAGLLLERGLNVCPEASDKRGEAIASLIQDSAKIKATEQTIYYSAYERWYHQHIDNEYSHLWFGKLDNSRLLIGLGEPGSIEASITLNHTYGTPFIPGSAVKGVVRAHAETRKDISKEVLEFMFGKEAADGRDEGGAAGYLIFHDAWWVPYSSPTPLTPEIVTVHHADYYKGEGAPTDFDSPNPNNQIAARGSFLFVVEGMGSLVSWAMGLLTQAMQERGVGAKSCAGYGYFAADEKLSDQYVQDKQSRLREIEEKQEQVRIEQGIENTIKEQSYTGITEQIYREMNQNKWMTNSNTFLDAAETWIEKIKTEPDSTLQKKSAELLVKCLIVSKKNKGIMDDPNKVKGKKGSSVYNERPKNIAIQLRYILGVK